MSSTPTQAEVWEQSAPPRGRGATWLVLAGLAVVGALLVRGTLAGDEPDPGLRVQQVPTPSPTAEAGHGWQVLPPAPLEPRREHVLAWSGPCPADAAPPACGEVLVWGGTNEGERFADGAAYRLGEDRWRPLPDAPRTGAAPGVWADAPDRPGALIAWGATSADRGSGAARAEPRGVAYTPQTGQWRVLAEAPIAARTGHSLTWTGAEVVVWGGRLGQPWQPSQLLDDGAAYDPETDTWRELPEAPIEARARHGALAHPDGRVIIFGGHDAAGQPRPDGAVYDPDADRWTLIEPPPVPIVAPAGMFEPALALTPDGTAVHVVAPIRERSRGDPLVVTYHLDEQRWTTFASGPVGLRSGAHAATLGDGGLLVWGGRAPRRVHLDDGARHDPAAGGWELLPGAPPGLADHAAVQAGDAFVVWGGTTRAPSRDGARLDLAAP